MTSQINAGDTVYYFNISYDLTSVYQERDRQIMNFLSD